MTNRISISAIVVLFIASTADAEAPLQPIKNIPELPIELQQAPMVAVVHQWSPLDRPWKTVSHVTFPTGFMRFIDGDHRVRVFNPKSKRIETAQINVVAVNGAGVPEVVEAMFADEVSPGANVRCLFRTPGETPSQPPQDDDQWTLVKGSDAVRIRLTDGLGAKYSAELFDRRAGAIKNGPLEFTEEFFSVLRPDDAKSASAKQLFRFHTFLTARKGEPWFDVRVIVENCPSENPVCEFPYVSLEFGVKDREIVWEESLLPTHHATTDENGWKWTAAIPPDSNGKLHVAQDHFLMRLRFALTTPAKRGQAAVRMQHEPLYVAIPGTDAAGKATSSWNLIPSFGPTRVGVPRGDGPHAAIRDRVDRDAETWRGQNPLLKRFGPFWVHGEVGGEAPSGTEIAFTSPWTARFIQSGGAPSAWRVVNAAFDANLARQRFGFWKSDGSLWTLDDVLETKENVLCTPELNIHSGVPHPTPYCRKFGRTERRTEPGYLALKQVIDEPGRVADYVKELGVYTNHDSEHLCRWTQYLFPLVWLGNDPSARAILELEASMSMASSNPFPTGPNNEASSGSLAELHRIAAESPGRGSPHLARGAGWNAQAVVGGLAVTRNPSLRRLGAKWLSDFARLPAICQLPTGGVHRTDGDQTATFDFNGDGSISVDERNMPVEHGSIYMQGIYRLAGGRSVLMQLDPSRQATEISNLEGAMRKLDRYFIDFAWDDSVDLPGWNAAVVVKSKPATIITLKRRGTVWGGSPDAAFYFDDILAEAYRFSGDERFLEKLAAMHGGEMKVERDSGNGIHAAWVLESVKKPPTKILKAAIRN